MSAQTIRAYRAHVATERPGAPEVTKAELFEEIDRLEKRATKLEARPARMRARAADLREVVRKMSEE